MSRPLIRRMAILPIMALLCAFAGQSQGAEMEEEVELRNKLLVQEKFDAWRNGTGSPFEILADDATWTIVGNSVASRTYRSREEFIREVIGPFNARMTKGLVPTIKSLHADGNTVIAYFDAESVATDGKPYRNTYAWFMELRDGKIAKATAFFDSIEFNDLWSRVKPVAGR